LADNPLKKKHSKKFEFSWATYYKKDLEKLPLLQKKIIVNHQNLKILKAILKFEKK